MNKTKRNTLIVLTIVIITAVLTGVILLTETIIRKKSNQTQDFTYRVTTEENLRVELAEKTIDINNKIAQFNNIKEDLNKQILYAREQKNSLRVQDVPLAFH